VSLSSPYCPALGRYLPADSDVYAVQSGDLSYRLVGIFHRQGLPKQDHYVADVSVGWQWPCLDDRDSVSHWRIACVEGKLTSLPNNRGSTSSPLLARLPLCYPPGMAGLYWEAILGASPRIANWSSLVRHWILLRANDFS
jgi:hypothetical protein